MEEKEQKEENTCVLEPPAVIDDVMLRQAVEEQGPKGRAGEMAKEEVIDFGDVVSLRLGYKHILEINNLWCFVNIVNLELTHNVIEKIEGLDILVHLVKLDLSFNFIEKIENLHCLTKLEDLTLFNNEIMIIENLEMLTNLNVLSLGNNLISDLKSILYFRRFKKLKSLCLSGNPLTDNYEEYMMYAISFLPNIEYYDYFLADETLKQKGFEKYEIAILLLDEEDGVAMTAFEEQAEKRKTWLFHEEAFVEELDGEQLFDAMYAKDVDGKKFNTYKDIEELYDVFKEKFVAICQGIFAAGIKKHAERSRELTDFRECVAQARREGCAKSIVKINEFLDYKEHIWDRLEEAKEKTDIQALVEEYTEKMDMLFDYLVDYEIILVDQLEEMIKDLQRFTEELNSQFLEFAHSQFSLCRDLENLHNERVMELVGFMADRAARHEEDEDVTEELAELLLDKASAMGSVAASHDLHLFVLDARQDTMTKHMHEWHDALIEDLHENVEITRNRDRILEICNFSDYNQDEFSDVADDLLSRSKHVLFVG